MAAVNNAKEIAILEGLKSHLEGITQENYKDVLRCYGVGLCRVVKNYILRQAIDDDFLDNINSLLKVFFCKWDLFSGCRVCPVPHSTKSSTTAYSDCDDKWDPQTEYGQNRWKLLSHVIASLEELIVQMKADQTLTLEKFVERESNNL